MKIRDLFLLLVIGLVFWGCQESSAPVSAAEVREMSSTPFGMWSSKDPNVNLQVQFDAGEGLTYVDANGSQSGTYKFDEAGKTISVELGGRTDTWTFERKDLDLKLTFADGKTVELTMQ